MLLSAALIVRDEAEHLDACLTSLAGLVDEIVVVDTGSSDDSVAVARRHGAVLGHEPWQEDFATPRNRSLDLATGEWILYIDADERVHPGDRAAARAAIAAATDHMALRIPLVPRVGWTPYREYRLWRHRPDVRFEGRMHESIVGAITAVAQRERLEVSPSDVVILEHFGYEGDQAHKHERNLPMLLAGVEATPGRIFYYDHLARTYEDLGDDDRAVEWWRRGIDVARARPVAHPDDRLCWVNLIIHQLVRHGGVDATTAPLIAEGLERFPGLPALELAAATHEFATGAPEAAVRRVEWILSLSLEEVMATGSAYDERVLGEWPWNLLGLCRLALGDPEAAAPGNEAYAVRRRLAEVRVKAAG